MPPPGFSIAQNPERFSNVHFKFRFSLISVAYKRTHLMSECGKSAAAKLLMTALQSPLITWPWAARGSLVGINAQCSSPCYQRGRRERNQKYTLAKMKSVAHTSSLAGPRLNLTPGRPSFGLKTVPVASDFFSFGVVLFSKTCGSNLLIPDDLILRK